MDVTISLDEALVERARAVAARRGKTLDQLVRDLLEAETGAYERAEPVRAIEALWASPTGRSGGARFRREGAYEGRLE